MKQLSPQKIAAGHSAVAHHTATKGISHPAASTTDFPIQRKPAFHVEPDNSEKMPPEIEDQWKTTVELALLSLVDSTPDMNELIKELQTDRLNVNFILANTNQRAKSAIGKTENPEVPAVIDALATTPEGQLDVGHLTAAPQKELNIYVYKQGIHGAGTTLQTRYDLSHPQIHSTILHELMMHGRPHHEHMKLREQLTDRPKTVEKEELEKYSIPELYSSLNAIVEAKDHKLLSLWQEKGVAAKAYKDNDLVSSKEMVLHHVNDILEHISMDKFDDTTREKLVQELISISAEMGDTNINASITATARLLHDEVLRSGTIYGFPMTDGRKSAIETLYSKFPSPEEKSPLVSDEESEESEEKLPQPKKKKLIPQPQPQTGSLLSFLPPPKNTPGGNSNTGPTPFSLNTSPSVNRSSLFDTLPQPQNTPTNRPSLFSLLPPPKNSEPKGKSDNDKQETS